MVLIVSETHDITTDRVIEWLFKFGYSNILRVNDGTPIYVRHISLGCSRNEIILDVNNITFSVEDVEFFWYRRGLFRFDIKAKLDFDLQTDNFGKAQNFHKNEWVPVRNYVIRKLEQKAFLGDFNRIFTNKILNLEIAQKCGLRIPKTHISNYSRVIRENIDNEKDYICKPVSETLHLEDDEYEYSTFTKKILKEDIRDEIRYCTPQFIQECIEKWIELRVFIIKRKLFVMAIFSQREETTSVDFRNGGFGTRPRVTPFTLPMEIENKLLQFMDISGYSTGSLDLILTQEGDYIFLEVNPIGVIDMVSTPCNYMIEKEIATYIMNSMN